MQSDEMDMGSPSLSFGFASIAAGSLSYGEMAVDMALSLRQFHDDPVLLLADAANKRHIERLYPGVFDSIILIPPRYRNPFSTKFALADLLPMERGMFIDADTIALGPLDAAIEQTERDNIVMMGHYLPATTDQAHHGIPIRLLCEKIGTDRFLTCHSGAFGYRRDGARTFFDEAFEVFSGQLDRFYWRRKGFIGDELAFGLAAATRQVARFDSGDPVLWPDELASLRLAAPAKPLCHFYTMPPESVFRELLAQVIARREKAGLQTGRCEAAWRRKQRLKARKPKAIVQRLGHELRVRFALPRHTGLATLPKQETPLPPAAAGFGFVTIAMKSRAYSEMAVDMVLSLREFHDDPVCLFADDLCANIVEDEYPGVFDHVVRLSAEDLTGHVAKFLLAEYTPYDRALFIDADILVVGDLTIFKRQAAVDPMFMMGTFKSDTNPGVHHALRIRDLCQAFGLEHFYANHSAFFGFQRKEVRAFLAEGRRVYLNELFRRPWLRSGMVGDEICFGIIAGRYGMGDMVKPYPVIWNAEFKALKPGEPPAALAHFQSAPSPEGLEWLMEGVNARRNAAALPAISADAWRAKAASSEAKWRRKSIPGKVRDVGRSVARIVAGRGASAAPSGRKAKRLNQDPSPASTIPSTADLMSSQNRQGTWRGN